MRVDDIVNQVFARSFMGYDIEQVDLFLDEIIERFEQYEAEKKEMLLAMEYLLNKLENNQKLPITEMRKAIDSGKTKSKRAQQSTRRKGLEAAVSRLEQTEETREETKPARSIARGAQPPKPMRAPKVSRVRTEQEPSDREMPKEAAMTQKNAKDTPGTKLDGKPQAAVNDAPAAENWLDELLMNLIEREKVGYGEPLSSAEKPNCNNGDIDPQKMETEGAEPEGSPQTGLEDEPPAVEEEPR
ncbi:MAG: DivIVA domain-containing protein [Eubacteriales bacterium]|nr:DivIVA domain-containing protein [Eubacteriales bacterium]